MTPVAWVYMTDTATKNYMLGGCGRIEQMLGGLRMFAETDQYDKMEARFDRVASDSVNPGMGGGDHRVADGDPGLVGPDREDA